MLLCAQLCYSYCKDIRVLHSYQRKQLVTEDSCSVISSQESIEESSRRKKKTQSNHLFLKYIHAACNFSARKIAGNTTLGRDWKMCTVFELRGYKNLIAGESHCTGKRFLHKYSAYD